MRLKLKPVTVASLLIARNDAAEILKAGGDKAAIDRLYVGPALTRHDEKNG